MTAYDEHRLAELIKALPPAPEAWVEAAQELPLARGRLDDIVARAEADSGRPVIVTGGPDEVELAHDVARRARLPDGVVHAGNGGVLALGRLVAAADRVICGDTGIAHLATAVGTIGAYALARLRFLGRGFMASATLITYLVPPSILFIPLYAQIKNIGLANSLAGLIAAYPSFTVPFVTWLLMGYFESIPVELEESAMIDGATRFGAFRRIILPLAAPGVLAAALYAFTQAWNEFLYALVFITDARLRTLPVGLASISQLTLNMATARTIGFSPDWITLTEADLLAAVAEEFQANEDLPNTTNPDDWAKIAGRRGERIVHVRPILPDREGRKGRRVETVAPGHYL